MGFLIKLCGVFSLNQEYLCCLIYLFILVTFGELVWPCYSAVIACSVFLRFLMLHAFTSSCCSLTFMLLGFVFGTSFSLFFFHIMWFFRFFSLVEIYPLQSCAGLLVKLCGAFLLKQDYLFLLISLFILEIFWGLVWPCYSAVIALCSYGFECSMHLRRGDVPTLYTFDFYFGLSLSIIFCLYNAVFFPFQKIFFLLILCGLFNKALSV